MHQVHTGPICREGVFGAGSLDVGHRTLSYVRYHECFCSEPPDAHHQTRSCYCVWVRCVHPNKYHSPDAQSASDAAPDAANTSIWQDFFKLSTGTIENMCFIFSKAPNPASQARRKGERNPNPSLPLELHLLCKCANTTK